MSYQISLSNLLVVLYFVSNAARSEAREGTFSFASYYGDHMVLQRGPQRANIWGYSPNFGDNVTVTVGSQQAVSTLVVSGQVSTDGLWTVKLPIITQPGPYIITAQSSAGNISLNDVLFGDVWICSGQSNMQVSVSMVINASAEIADADNYPNIRVMTVGVSAKPTLQTDIEKIWQKWSVATRSSIGGPDWNYFSAVCWLYGKYLYRHRGYPIGLVASDWGGTPIEPWTSPEGLKTCNINAPNPLVIAKHVEGEFSLPSEPTVVWNSMMAPFTKMIIFGAIWYQGESNAGNPSLYKCSFPAMIQDWRKKFHEGSNGETDASFPFGFVQLAPVNKFPKIGGFPGLRWAQTANFGYTPNALMKKVFMAVAIDLPDFDSPYGGLSTSVEGRCVRIHPRTKQDIGLRLGLAAEAVAYGVPGIKYQGPFPTTISVNPSKGVVIIEMDRGGTTIDVRSKDGYEVCCSNNTEAVCHEYDPEWKKTPIVDQFTSSVHLDYHTNCGAGARIMGVRYAWLESPCDFKQCAVYNRESNIPAPPYLALGFYA